MKVSLLSSITTSLVPLRSGNILEIPAENCRISSSKFQKTFNLCTDNWLLTHDYCSIVIIVMGVQLSFFGDHFNGNYYVVAKYCNKMTISVP